GGQLTSLDMTVSSNFQVGNVTFGTNGLEFTWTKSSNTFTLGGTVFVTIGGIGNLIATFGHGSTPGLVITSGALTSLDMTLSSNFQIGSVTFGTNGLELTYTRSTDIFTLAGTASVAITGIGNLSVTFGHGSSPALVLTSGALTSLDMTVSSNF